MANYKCKVCGFRYDTEVGMAEIGIKPGTPFEELPEDWKCPGCYYPKEVFEKID